MESQCRRTAEVPAPPRAAKSLVSRIQSQKVLNRSGGRAHLQRRRQRIAVIPGHRERIAENGFDGKAVRSWREAIAGTKLDVDLANLEIRDHKQLLALLLQRQEAADSAEVRVVFEADEAILPEVAGKSNRRREIGLATCPGAQVDNRIDDKFPLRVAHADDWPDFESPGGRREPGQFIACLLYISDA